MTVLDPGGVVSQDIPNCATLYMFELNGLHYYETIDCAASAQGWGVSDRMIQGVLGCTAAGGTCPNENIVDPAFRVLALLSELSETLRTELGTSGLAPAAQFDESVLRTMQNLIATTIQSRFPIGSNRKRRVKNEIGGFRRRFNGGNGDTSQRRENAAEWIDNNVQQLIDGSTLHQRYWGQVTTELCRVIHDGVGGPGKQLFVQDRFFPTISSINTGPLSSVFKEPDPAVVAAKVEPTLGAANLPYVKVRRKGNPFEAGDRDEFFRVMNITLYDQSVLNIGMQIEEEDLTNFGVNLNQVQLATFVDRHEHFHIIRANATDYSVYSPNSFRATEDFI